jgi:hypothetical protein
MRFKYSFFNFAFLLLVLLLGPNCVVAQVDEKEKAEKEAEQRQELERKTFALVDEIVSGSWGLKLPENRSFVQASAADLLWKHDEKGARILFWDALNSLGLRTDTVDDTTAKDAKDLKSKSAPTKTQANEKAQKEYFEAYSVRRNFLIRVARRDPQLALDMLRATRPPPIPPNPNYRLPDDSDLEQEIANQAAESDPKKALQIARESLAKGLTFQLLSLLNSLNQKHQDLATEFAGDIIEKVHTVDLVSDADAFWIGAYLLQASRTPKADGEKTENQNFPTVSWHQLKLSDDQRRDLVELLIDAASSASAHPNLAGGLDELMPEIELFAPDRVATIKAKMAQVNRTLNKDQQDWKTYESLFRTATPEQMIRTANTLGEEQRRTLYREAVSLAVMRNRAEALRETINAEIPDESQRKALLDSLDAEEVGAAIYQGNVDELQKLLPRIRLKEQRATAMAELAMMLDKKGRHEEALKLLQDARPLIKIDFNSDTQSRAFLAVLMAYALIDPPQAFAMAEPIIDRANDNISKLLFLDKIVHSGAVKSGEIVMQDPGVPLDFAFIRYGRGVVALANADFTRTKALADRFQRSELKIMARLLIAQSILRSLEAPDKPEAPTDNFRSEPN